MARRSHCRRRAPQARDAEEGASLEQEHGGAVAGDTRARPAEEAASSEGAGTPGMTRRGSFEKRGRKA